MKRVNSWVVLVFALLCWGLAASVLAQEKTPEGPKMVLSETEQLKLENLKMRQQLLNVQIQNLQNQIQQAQAQLRIDVTAFAEKTFKDHGAPQEMRWNAVSMEFEALPGLEKKPESQSSSGPNSPNIKNVEGPVTVQYGREDPKK